VRERVAQGYVRASNNRVAAEKLIILSGLYDTLKAALETYPESTQRPKAEHNLLMIEQEIRKLDPTWFDTHPPYRGGDQPIQGGAAPK
jgi:hypothetical protein